VAPDEEIPVVCFELAGELYAADVDHVREIIRPQDVSPVPKAPAFIEGMTNLRGKVVPVVNFRRLMGFPSQEQTKRTRVLIVEFNHQLVGAVVDGVSQVTRLPTTSIEPPSHIVTRIDTAYLKGVAPVGEQIAIVLDMDRVLDDAQEKAIVALNARQE
jgi:purine-binding chemotaxis protein CheW